MVPGSLDDSYLRAWGVSKGHRDAFSALPGHQSYIDAPVASSPREQHELRMVKLHSGLVFQFALAWQLWLINQVSERRHAQNVFISSWALHFFAVFRIHAFVFLYGWLGAW